MASRTLGPTDLEQIWQLDSDAFHGDASQRERFLRHTDPTDFVGAFEGDRLVAMSGAHRFGQFFGGRPVPMGGLCSVAVAPDRRDAGLGQQVVGASLRMMAERGDRISTLYPGTTRLYRNLGWELGGAFVWRRLRPRDLLGLPRPEGVTVRPGTPADLPAMRRCYAEIATSVNGFLDRREHWWRRLAEKWQSRSVFVAERAGAIEGYLVYQQTDGEYGALGGPFGIAVDECPTASRDAMLALWRLLGSWSSQVDTLLYRSGPEDPLFLLLPEQDSQTLAEIRWMTRVVDAPGAIEARGFATGMEAEVPLTIRDPQLPANDGAWTLHVEAGCGRLARGGSGAVSMSIGAFSSLYTGWGSSAVLARAGLLEGGTPAERAALDAAFAGPTPWMLEEF